MTDRSRVNEPSKYDHSGHPTHRSEDDDLAAPGGGRTVEPSPDRPRRGGVVQDAPVAPTDSQRD